MLQLNYIRQNPEMVKQKLAVRNFREAEIVDEIIRLDEDRRKLQIESEQIQSRLNIAAKEIGQLMSKGARDQAENKKAEVASLKSSIEPIVDELNSLEKQLQDTVIRLPNLPHDKVPAGKTPEENVVVREGGKTPALPVFAV